MPEPFRTRASLRVLESVLRTGASLRQTQLDLAGLGIESSQSSIKRLAGFLGLPIGRISPLCGPVRKCLACRISFQSPNNRIFRCTPCISIARADGPSLADP